MPKWKWLGLETRRCSNSAQIVGYMINASLFSVFPHSLTPFTSYLHFFCLQTSSASFLKRCNSSPSFSLSHTSSLSLSLPNCSSFPSFLFSSTVILHQISFMSSATPRSVSAPVPLLFSPLKPKNMLSAARLHLIHQYRGEYTIILYVIRLYPVFEHIKGFMNTGMQCIIFLLLAQCCRVFYSTELLKLIVFLWRRWSPEDCFAVLSRVPCVLDILQ